MHQILYYNTPITGVRKMMYGYARCATDVDMQDFECQRRELKKMGIKDSDIYLDYENGIDTDHINLDRLFSMVKHGDSIVSTKVSRLTHSTKQICKIIEFVKEKRLKLIIGTFELDCTNELDLIAQGMTMMYAIFAEIERNLVSQLIRSGMRKAKVRGRKIGRPKTNLDNLPTLFLKYVHLCEYNHITQKELAILCRVSRQSIRKYIKIYREEHLKEAINADAKQAEKDVKKEEKIIRNYKSLDEDELEVLAEDEETTVSQEGISAQWTPATLELRRRRRVLEKIQAEKDAEEEMARLEELHKTVDLSEFDL